MLVKCKCCNNKIERDIAYKVVEKNKNTYYCNQLEYDNYILEKESRTKVFELVYEIIGNTTNTAINKEISEIGKIHTYKKLHGYMTSNKDNLIKYMSRNFSNEYGKIKYFSTIIKNNILDHVVENTKFENKEINIEVVNINYKPKQKRKPLINYIDEY